MFSDDAPRIVQVQPTQKRGESARARNGVVHGEQFEYEEIGDDELAGENRRRGRRVGEKSVDDSDKAFVASSEKEGCVSAAS